MAEVHHFSFGAFNPVAAFLMAFLGSLLGLLCTSRARRARTRGRRTRWLAIAAVAIGGAAIWLMHFMAMLGFDLPDSPVRYDPGLTLASLLIAVLTVGIGLAIVGHGRRSAARILGGGVFTGLGVLAMHYTGMAALHVAGTIEYHPLLVAASAAVAIVAATVALWFTVSVRGWAAIIGAAAIMAVAVCGMHYTGMAAMVVRLRMTGDGAVAGISPFLLIVPITLLTAATLLGMAFSALQAMTEEEFTGGVPRPPANRGVHAETPWSLRSTNAPAPARVGRPSPYPRTGPTPYPVKAGRPPYART
ncbi:MAG TPA: MHYT domain-containing protein, partial [Catenuloplanes sp.]